MGPPGRRPSVFGQHGQDQQRKRMVRGDSPWTGGFPRRGDSQACGRDALRDRACARMEAPGRLELSRVARGKRMIASRARSDPIPLPLGSIPDPASVLLFESMNQPVSSTGGGSIVSTVWAPPGGGYSRYGAGSSSYGPVGLKSGSGAQIGVTTTLASYEFGDENQLVSVTQGTDRRTTFVYTGKGGAGSPGKKPRARPGNGSLLQRPAMSMTACG